MISGRVEADAVRLENGFEMRQIVAESYQTCISSVKSLLGIAALNLLWQWPKYSIPTGLYIDIITQDNVVGDMAKQFFCSCAAGLTKTSNHNETVQTHHYRDQPSTCRGNNIFMICSFSQANPQKYEWLKHLLSNKKWILDKQHCKKTNVTKTKAKKQKEGIVANTQQVTTCTNTHSELQSFVVQLLKTELSLLWPGMVCVSIKLNL